MTLLSNAAVYSFYTPLSEAGIVGANRHPFSMPLHTSLRRSLNGDILQECCGAYCSRKARTAASGIGIDIVTWGGLDLKQEHCICERKMLARPVKWILSSRSECYNVNCGFYNSIVDPLSHMGNTTYDLARHLANAEHMLTHIPLMRLVATAEHGLHFRRKNTTYGGSAKYVNPVGAGWRANYAGRILPAAMGSRLSAVGESPKVLPRLLNSCHA